MGKKTGGKRGRPSWADGTKEVFLSLRAGDWQIAVDQGLRQTGDFYTKLTKLWILKYGWHFDPMLDLEVDTEDPLDDAVDDVDLDADEIDEAEREKRHKYHTSMRTVCYFLISHIN